MCLGNISTSVDSLVVLTFPENVVISLANRLLLLRFNGGLNGSCRVIRACRAVAICFLLLGMIVFI